MRNIVASLVLALLVQRGVCAQPAPAGPPSPVVARITLFGTVTDMMAAQFERALAVAAEHAANEVHIVIDSPGGSVDAGRRIVRAIESVSVPVACVVDGEADSMAFYILQACPVRAMTARSVLMTHEVIQMVSTPNMDTPIFFTAEDLENLAVETRAESEALAQHCAARLRISMAEYKRRVAHGRRWWLAAHEALRVGAVDQVLDSPNRPPR